MLHINDIPFDLFLEYYDETANTKYSPSIIGSTSYGNAFKIGDTGYLYLQASLTLTDDVTPWLDESTEFKQLTSYTQESFQLYSVSVEDTYKDSFYPLTGYFESEGKTYLAQLSFSEPVKLITDADTDDFNKAIELENSNYSDNISNLKKIKQLTLYTPDGKSFSTSFAQMILGDKTYFKPTSSIIIEGYELTRVYINEKETRQETQNGKLVYKTPYGAKTTTQKLNSNLMVHQAAIRNAYNHISNNLNKFMETGDYDTISFIRTGNDEKIAAKHLVTKTTVIKKVNQNNIKNIDTNPERTNYTLDDLNTEFKTETSYLKTILQFNKLREYKMATTLTHIPDSPSTFIASFDMVPPLDRTLLLHVYHKSLKINGKTLLPKADGTIELSIGLFKEKPRKTVKDEDDEAPAKKIVKTPIKNTIKQQPNLDSLISSRANISAIPPTVVPGVDISGVREVDEEKKYTVNFKIQSAPLPYILLPIKKTYIPEVLSAGARQTCQYMTLRTLEGKLIGIYEIYYENGSFHLVNTDTNAEQIVYTYEEASLRFGGLPEEYRDKLYTQVMLDEYREDELSESPVVGQVSKDQLNRGFYTFTNFTAKYTSPTIEELTGLHAEKEYSSISSDSDISVLLYSNFAQYNSEENVIKFTNSSDKTNYVCKRTPILLADDYSNIYVKIEIYTDKTASATRRVYPCNVATAEETLPSFVDSDYSKLSRGNIVKSGIYSSMKESSALSMLTTIAGEIKDASLSEIISSEVESPAGLYGLLNLRNISEGYVNMLTHDSADSTQKKYDIRVFTELENLYLNIQLEHKKKKDVPLFDKIDVELSGSQVNKLTNRTAFDKLRNYEKYPTDESYYNKLIEDEKKILISQLDTGQKEEDIISSETYNPSALSFDSSNISNELVSALYNFATGQEDTTLISDASRFAIEYNKALAAIVGKKSFSNLAKLNGGDDITEKKVFSSDATDYGGLKDLFMNLNKKEDNYSWEVF